MSILEEADDIINGERAESYGSPLIMCNKIAGMWSQILGSEVTPKQVNLCMIALKICRETNKHSRDNLIDIAGYAGVIEKMMDEAKREENNGRKNLYEV